MSQQLPLAHGVVNSVLTRTFGVTSRGFDSATAHSSRPDACAHGPVRTGDATGDQTGKRAGIGAGDDSIDRAGETRNNDGHDSTGVETGNNQRDHFAGSGSVLAEGAIAIVLCLARRSGRGDDPFLAACVQSGRAEGAGFGRAG